MRFGLFAINYGTCGDPEVALRIGGNVQDTSVGSS
jgi:hypothetical protein